MIPGLDLFLSGGAGGLDASSSATAATGPVSFGGFNFQPKGGSLPPLAWIAFAVAGVVALIFLTRRRA